jgi:hypothetical protein
MDYAAPAADVRRVFTALSTALADEGRVWLDRRLQGTELTADQVVGTALVEIFVTSREWAHGSVRRALADIDPERTVIAGGDLRLEPIDP